MARRSGRASMPPSVGGMQGMGASTTYFVPTKLRGKEAQEAVELLNRLADDDPVTLLCSISEQLARRNPQRFKNTVGLLKEVLKRAHTEAEAMGISKMHSKRILTDGKQEAAPPSDPYGFSEPPRTVELSSGSKGIVSRSGVKVIPNDAKKALRPMAIETERPSTPPAYEEEGLLPTLTTMRGSPQPIRRTQKFLTNKQGDVNINTWLGEKKQKEVRRNKVRWAQINKELRWIKQIEVKQKERNSVRRVEEERSSAAKVIQKNFKSFHSRKQIRDTASKKSPTKAEPEADAMDDDYAY